MHQSSGEGVLPHALGVLGHPLYATIPGGNVNLVHEITYRFSRGTISTSPIHQYSYF